MTGVVLIIVCLLFLFALGSGFGLGWIFGQDALRKKLKLPNADNVENN